MNRLLLITSALALSATPALAQVEVDPNSPRIDQGAIAPTNQPALDADETQMDVDGDGDLEILKNGYTDAHPWVNAPAFVQGERVGEIERVHYDGARIDMLVIETGGVAEIGGREVEIKLEDAEHITADDGADSFLLAFTKTGLEALPDFDESLASDYPLSDGLDEDEGDEDPTADQGGGLFDEGAD
jgi:hypothetical protein